MNVLLWVFQCLLALALAGFGVARLARPRERVVSAFPYLEPFPGSAIKALGLLEVMAGLGLVLPGATGIAPSSLDGPRSAASRSRSAEPWCTYAAPRPNPPPSMSCSSLC